MLNLAVLIAQAQIKDTKTGKIKPSSTPTPQTTLPIYSDADTLSVDFKNFAYADFGLNLQKFFTLKNGFYSSTNPKTKEFRSFQFRKVYYFDITGDRKTEAIVHLLADSCDSCDEKSVFYAFSAVDKKPLEVFRILTGSGDKCGLKSVSFNFTEITLEVFGDCELKNGVFTKTQNPPKSDVLTKFLFEFGEREFAFKSKVTSDFPLKDAANVRPQIKIGQ